MRTRIVAAVVLLTVGVVAACGFGAEADRVATSPSSEDSLTGADLVARLDPDDAVASCAFGFSAETLGDRAFAFDGTVVATRAEQDPRAPSPESDMNRVEFEVHEWFAGGEEPTAKIWVAADLVPGDRLLASGEPRWGGVPLEDAIAWLGCGGFTVPYSDEKDAYSMGNVRGYQEQEVG